MEPKHIIVFLIAIIISLSIHEWAHAYAAFKLGDSTAKDQGRLTWNPLYHLDPLGTVMLVFLAVKGVGLGWAKPVPVNAFNLQNPRRDLMLVSFAGPFSNVIQAIIGMFLLGIFTFAQLGAFTGASTAQIIMDFLQFFIRVNVGLFLFNMLPFYPLDGSKIYSYFMPKEIAFRFEAQLVKWGMMPLLVLIVLEWVLPSFGVLSAILGPMSTICAFLIEKLVLSILGLVF